MKRSTGWISFELSTSTMRMWTDWQLKYWNMGLLYVLTTAQFPTSGSIWSKTRIETKLCGAFRLQWTNMDSIILALEEAQSMKRIASCRWDLLQTTLPANNVVYTNLWYSGKVGHRWTRFIFRQTQTLSRYNWGALCNMDWGEWCPDKVWTNAMICEESITQSDSIVGSGGQFRDFPWSLLVLCSL